MPNSHVVPCNDLATFLAPYVKEIDRGLDPNFSGRNGSGETSNGAIQIIAERAAVTLARAWETEVTVEATIRRFWAIRSGEQYSIGLTIAEAFLNAVDVHIGETDIPILATSYDAAWESVEAFYPRMPNAQQKVLANQLYKFSVAYIEESADDKTKERVAMNNAKRRAIKRGMSLEELLAHEAAERARETEREEVAA